MIQPSLPKLYIQMFVLQGTEVEVKRASLLFVELTFGCFRRISRFVRQYGKNLYIFYNIIPQIEIV